jgi:glucose/arabinose dehydrogenase
MAICLWVVLTYRPAVPENIYESEPTVSVAPSSVYQTKDIGVIWSFLFLDHNQVLLSQRNGKIKQVNLATRQEKDIALPFQVFVWGQGGLMDIALDPSYPKKPWLYFTYSVKQPDDGIETRVSRARWMDGKLDKLEVLFTSDSGSQKREHFGSRLAFDQKGHMFFGVGDRGDRDQAQNLTASGGKIYRLRLDGSAPKDNPFVQDPNVHPGVWSYGHRNPQGTVYDHQTDTLWVTEHGPRGGDELNRIIKGANYGWPLVTYGREYSGLPVGEGLTHIEGIERPVHFYVPSIAPSSLLLYRGQQYPGYEGAFVIPALAGQHINVLIPNEGKILEERWLEDMEKRFRHVAVDPKGYLWASTDTGKLMRILPKGYSSTGVVPSSR